MVSTQDSESCDLSSSLGRTSLFYGSGWFLNRSFYSYSDWLVNECILIGNFRSLRCGSDRPFSSCLTVQFSYRPFIWMPKDRSLCGMMAWLYLFWTVHIYCFLLVLVNWVIWNDRLHLLRNYDRPHWYIRDLPTLMQMWFGCCCKTVGFHSIVESPWMSQNDDVLVHWTLRTSG